MFYTTSGLPVNELQIDVLKVFELRYWCVVLKCDIKQLRLAIKAVGCNVYDVKRFLNPESEHHFYTDANNGN